MSFLIYCSKTHTNFLQSLVHCRSAQSQQRVGVELLEASVSDLNKYELRRTHQFGSFKYDPGKYFSDKKGTDGKRQGREDEDDELSEAEEGDVLQNRAGYEDELEAPWNQHAWTEEMRLRVSFLQCCLALGALVSTG